MNTWGEFRRWCGAKFILCSSGCCANIPCGMASLRLHLLGATFEVFIANQGLGHTISPDAPQIAVISCVDGAYLFGHFGEALVSEHRRVREYICEVTADAPFENHLYECHSVSDALRTMREWTLPLLPAERHLLVAELEGIQFMGDEDPNFIFARISCLETTMRAVGIKKRESDIVHIILRQLPERYDIVKIMTLTDPQLTRSRLENTIRSAYSQRKAPRNCKTRASGECAGGTPEPACSCRRPWFSGRGGCGRWRPTKERRYGTWWRWHAAAAAAAAATLVSRRWHAAAAAATAAMNSRRWYSSSAST